MRLPRLSGKRWASEMSVDLQRIRTNLLNDAEQDYAGLYEVVWDAARDAGSTEAERIAAARIVVTQILSEHNGRLFRSSTWPPSSYDAIALEE